MQPRSREIADSMSAREVPGPAREQGSARPASPPSPLSKCQTNERHLYRVLSYACLPSPYGERTKGWNMPALKEISFEYARQIATVKGLRPSKVKGTNTLRFS